MKSVSVIARIENIRKSDMQIHTLMTISRRILQLGYFSIALYFYLFFNAAVVYAHSPHDVIDAVALSPVYHKDQTVFIAMEERLRRTTDGGASWKDIVNGLDNKFPFTAIAISPNFQIDKTLLAATSGNGIYRSRDSGASWVDANSGLQNLSIGRIVIFISDHVKLCFAADTAGNLYRSENWGDIWHTVLDQVKVKSIACSPDVHTNYLLAGAANGRLYISKDMGESWRLLYQDRSWGNINDIVLSPTINADKTFFVGTQYAGIFKTLDDGLSFVAVNAGLPEHANIQSLAISPDFEKKPNCFWVYMAKRCLSIQQWRRYMARIRSWIIPV